MAQYQNYVNNPDFDADLSFWQPFPNGDIGAQVSWTSDMNHFDESQTGTGAIRIAAPTGESFAQQCVGVENGGFYIVVTAWTFEQCAGAADLYVFWATNDCKYDGKYDSIHARSTKTGEWEQLQVVGLIPDDRHKVLVTLVSPGGCGKDPSAYFDGISFRFDSIYQDGFDPFSAAASP